MLSVHALPHHTLQSIMPPVFLSTHSLASIKPLSVETYKHSPGLVKPFTNCASLPMQIKPMSSTPIHNRFVGFEMSDILFSTGSLFQYFMPSHNRRVDMFSCVTSSGVYEERLFIGGGSSPPRVTDEMKPDFCSASISDRWRFERGIDVNPSFAFDAFCICEQTCARLTRDMAGRRPGRRWFVQQTRHSEFRGPCN